MLETSATVIALQQNEVLLKVEPSPTCGGCAASTDCSASLFSQFMGRKCVYLSVVNTVNAHTGQQVVIGVPERGIQHGLFSILFVPLIFLMCFSCVGEVLFDLSALFGGLGFVVGLGVVRIVLQPKLDNTYKPVILRKLI